MRVIKGGRDRERGGEGGRKVGKGEGMKKHVEIAHVGWVLIEQVKIDTVIKLVMHVL